MNFFRQLDDEKRRAAKVEKFIAKHAIADSYGFDELRALAGGGRGRDGKEKGDRDGSNSPLHSSRLIGGGGGWRGVPLQSSAGVGSNIRQGLYLRPEEQSPSDNVALEEALGAMHEGLIANAPVMLPVFRRLSEEIHKERARNLERTSHLLSMFGEGGSVRTKKEKEVGKNNRSVSPPVQKVRAQSASKASAKSDGQKRTDNISYVDKRREWEQNLRTSTETPSSSSLSKDQDAYQRLLRSLDPDRIAANKPNKSVSFDF